MIPETLSTLRSRHSTLRYLACTVIPESSAITIHYHFRLEPDIDFRPHITIPALDSSVDPTTSRLAFLLGMVELISYWKTACPERIVVEAGYLSADELHWWEHLFRRGLGEFFFINKISPDLPFSIFVTQTPTTTPQLQHRKSLKGSAVLVGGGKDSIVSLENMKRFNCSDAMPLRALSVNPIPASLEAISIAGYSDPLIIERTLDPQIHKLNSAGYLNGHTPYSAFLAFASTLAAWINGIEYIIASNETSASEGNAKIEGFEVNHQYSKSFEFESNFRDYLNSLNVPISYFSLLRPLNELQICALFSQLSSFHLAFRSCNREQTARARAQLTAPPQPALIGEKRPGWCGSCPKCVFTFLCLACFCEQEAVTDIFGVSPLTHPEFIEMAGQLSGNSDHKPFECVGTYREVQVALHVLHRKLSAAKFADQKLLNALNTLVPAGTPSLSQILSEWDDKHFLTAPLAEQLRKAIVQATGRLVS